VRCDIPAHVYQATYSPNTQWSEIFARGAEIRDYWQAQARKHDVYKYVKLQHRVDEAEWDDTNFNWRVTVHNLKDGTTSAHSFDFVITAIGRFNQWKLPDYPGLNDYQGHRKWSKWYTGRAESAARCKTRYSLRSQPNVDRNIVGRR
jgi:cation diffusion facilitator CzcD-associated flavoprotein CzcO